MDFLALEDFERFIEIVDRRDDLVPGIAEHVLIVERGQRLVLDDEDALDDLLAPAEQHGRPRQMTRPPQRTKQNPVPRRRSRGRIVPAERQPRNDGPQRIAKLLARAGIASRREIERMIAEGRIALDGETITTPATLLEDVAGLTVDGRPVRPAKATRLFRFYKPRGRSPPSATQGAVRPSTTGFRRACRE